MSGTETLRAIDAKLGSIILGQSELRFDGKISTFESDLFQFPKRREIHGI